MHEPMTDRENAIEAILAMAALAKGNPVVTVTGSEDTVFHGVLVALHTLGVTNKELATVTLKSTLVDTDSDTPSSVALRVAAQMEV